MSIGLGINALSLRGSRPSNSALTDPNNPGKSGLSAWWALNEDSGNALDSHTNGLTLTDNNTVGSQDGGRLFVRTNSEYFTRSSETLLQGGQYSFTIGFRFYMFDSLTHYPMWKDDGSSGTRDYAITLLAISGRTLLRIAVGIGGTGLGFVDHPDRFDAGSWIYALCWYDHTLNTVNSQWNDKTVATATGVTHTTAGNAAFYIGRRNSAFFSNMIMSNAFYSKRVYTADQRAFLINGGLGRSYSDLA